MNIQKLMRQAQEMQQQMQRDLAAAEFTASVGGGMVEVRLNGEKEVLSVHIDPKSSTLRIRAWSRTWCRPP